jgi:ubiquinone/menaquinone biosynthesis C-methylase UbiE
MTTPEESAKRIFGERAAHYVTSAVHTDPGVLERIVDLSSPESTWSVLDVGTGTGHTALALSPYVSHVVGVDLTPGMLAEADKLRSARNITNVEFSLADAHDLPFDDESFDLVTCRRAAHHFSHVTRALQEMQRVLRRGGTLVIDDRSVPEDDFVDKCMNTLDVYHDESHVRQYRVSEWRRMLETLNFRIVVSEQYTKHLPLSSLTKGVSKKNTKKIYEILESLDDERRNALNFTQVKGEYYINHWYVVILAKKH